MKREKNLCYENKKIQFNLKTFNKMNINKGSYLDWDSIILLWKQKFIRESYIQLLMELKSSKRIFNLQEIIEH
jgi:hypothetical protein